jgi:regulation of enolase protein 1 (concanavalin A-like superfamily)
MRKGSFLIISIISALLLTSLLIFEPNTQIVKAESYFSDNFNDGVADGWTQQLGLWAVTNGEYRVSVGILENGISTVNGLNLTDCIIETQLRFTDSVGYEAGIVFRYSDNAHYYAFQIGHEYDHMEIITYDAANPDYGNYGKRAVIQPLFGNNSIPINLNVNYTLRIEIQGTNFNAYFNGQHVLSWTDNSYSSGLVGLRARRADVNFDNFKIENATVQPAPFNDEFTQATLDSRWKTIDPAGGSTFSLTANPGYLRITSPPNRDLWRINSNYNAPRIEQEGVSGDFIVETKVSASWTEKYECSGIYIWKDQNNFIRLERFYGNPGERVSFEIIRNGQTDKFYLYNIELNPIYLKIVRSGDLFSSFYSSDGTAWIICSNYTFAVSGALSIGLYVVNMERSGDFFADFDYFRINSTAPIPTPTPSPTPSPSPVPIEPNQSLQSYSDDFSTDLGLWQYLGDAYRDQTNQYLVLTEPAYEQGGVAFFNVPFRSSFTANFSYKVGGGSGGDGFTMFFYKQKYSTIGSGGNIGFNSKDEITPGYGIEFDGWQNIAGGQPSPPKEHGDPSANHIALIKDYVGNHLIYVNDPRTEDNNWHKVTVDVQESSVRVFVDQGLVLQWNGTLDKTYDGFGFSGATGKVGTNWHLIDNFAITFHTLQKPLLTASCRSSASYSNFNVEIKGSLTFNGTGISDAPILLSYSVTGGKSWEDLTLVNTGSDGSYSAVWMPSVTGNYLLKAVWEGNEDYSDISTIVNFAVTPFAEQSVFSVTSNSTISEFSFNSTSRELSFGVSGESGTMGYVNVYIPKSLIGDISSLKVYLDGNQIEYTAESQSDCWLLYFTYQHSTHMVTINMGSQGQFSELLGNWIFYVILIAIVIVVIGLMLALRRRKKR